jgi:hypothetical protein
MQPTDMDYLINKIQERFKMHITMGASNALILEAERQLHVKFSPDYKEYLARFGALSFGSTELTGLNIDSYANVVSVTLNEIHRNNRFPAGHIVVENTGIEGMLVIQSEDGIVHEWSNEGGFGAKYPGLYAYLASRLE